MRDDRLASPVISTYAVGGSSPTPRRGAGLALPVMVILGTASVAAIVSVSFEGDTPISADQPPEADDLAAVPTAIARTAGEGRPNVSVRLDDATLAAQDTPGPQRSASAPRDLPMLSVLQPNSGTPVARPATPTRAAPSARPAPRPVRSVPPPDPTLTGSSQTATQLAASDSASSPTAAGDLALLDPALIEAAAPLAADGYGEPPERADGGELLAPEIAAAPASEPVPPALLADSRPALSPGPAGPSPTVPELEPAQLAAAEALPGEVGAPFGDADGDGESGAASFQPSEPTAGVAAERSAAVSIPEHLARIGERYAAGPEPVTAVPERSAIARDAPEAGQAALVESSVVLDVGESRGSSVIVQDDELVAIRLGELVSLLEDRLDHPLYVWMSSAAVASKFVTAETLAAAGIRTRYDPQRRQLVISTNGE
jgi:hypothetical protein